MSAASAALSLAMHREGAWNPFRGAENPVTAGFIDPHQELFVRCTREVEFLRVPVTPGESLTDETNETRRAVRELPELVPCGYCRGRKSVDGKPCAECFGTGNARC